MNSQETNIFSLSQQDTLVVKGIAICSMLCHHLYGFPPEGVVPYNGILAWIGALGKVCVALFLFCSGYGLTARYKDITTLKETLRFVRNRFIKFYTNYWVILFVFIPLGIFVYGRTWDIAYAGLNVPKRIVYELFGINGGCSYIPTWWFNQLIIVMYLLFPLLFRAVKQVPFIAGIVTILYLLFGDKYTLGIIELNIWLQPFMMGIYWNLFEDKLRVLSDICLSHKVMFALASFVLLVIAVFIRSSLLYPDDIRIDALLTAIILLCIVSTLRYLSKLINSLAFLGKHSMNIYLIHTFFNVPVLHGSEWLRVGGGFAILITFCIGISFTIEYIKKRLGVYALQKQLITK